MSGVTMEVKGLSQAIANLNKLTGAVKAEIGRASLAAGLSVIKAAVLGATYSTFAKQTGAIKAGFGIRVGHQLKGTVLSAVIVQYPQSIAGQSPMKAAFLRHRQSTRKRAVSLYQVAFWWRFLEFGTGPRRSVATPSSSGHGKRHEARVRRYAGAASRGAIVARSWVRPAAASTAQPSVDQFAATMRERVEQAVKEMPK